MTIEHHSVAEEFPEFKELIHQLKVTDEHFKHLLEEYDQVDREIVRLELGIEGVSDEHLEDEKKKRLQLKDEIYDKLVKAQASV